MFVIAEHLESSFAKLQKERDELAKMAQMEAERAATAEAERQRLLIECERMKHQTHHQDKMQHIESQVRNLAVLTDWLCPVAILL